MSSTSPQFGRRIGAAIPARAWALRQQGLTIAQIARRLGRKYTWTWHLVHRGRQMERQQGARPLNVLEMLGGDWSRRME